MKTFAICLAALFAVAFARSVIDDNVNGEYVFDGDEIEQIDDRIVGGEETTIEQHPHQISLRAQRGRYFQCGGSIISLNRALTASHCLRKDTSPTYYSIQAGSKLRTVDANAQAGTSSRFPKHAQWDTLFFANDIAILFWDELLTLSATVRPIQLPSANAAVPYGEDLTASGWGNIRFGGPATIILRAVTLPLVSNEECKRAYEGRKESLPVIAPDMVCAGGESDRGGCHGDSGGPLVHNNTLIGVTSWGDLSCNSKGSPTLRFVLAGKVWHLAPNGTV